MLTYPVTRFLIEHLRNDEGVFAAGMTISQLISVGLFAFGVIYWVVISRRPLGRYADTVEAKPAAELAAAAVSLPKTVQ